MAKESLPRDPAAPKRTRDFIDRAGLILDDLIRNGVIFRTPHGWDIDHSPRTPPFSFAGDSSADLDSSPRLIPGPAGATGDQGRMGPPGRDAVEEIDFPPMIFPQPWMGADYVAVYNSADQTCNHATPTYMFFDSERSDSNALHSASVSTSRITVAVGGIYIFSALVRWSANGIGDRTMVIQKNRAGNQGVQTVPAVTSGANTDQLITTTPIRLVAGDFLELYVNQSSGNTLTVAVFLAFSPNFGAFRIAP